MTSYQALWRIVAVLALALLVSGCAPGSATSTPPLTGTTSPSSKVSVGSTAISDGPGPPPIVLKDTSPGQLELLLSLIIGGYDPSTRGITELDISFQHQGRGVQFVAGEHIACNDLAVPGFGANFDLKVPSEVFSGKVITCSYSSGKNSATFTFTAPLAPVILSPQEHAQVARSIQTPVGYRISQAWPFYVVAIDPPQKAWTPESAPQSNPVLLDTSAFPPGPGSIALGQYFTLADLRGPAFRSVKAVGGSAQYEIQVNWV